jgi:hypothetical protein
MFERLREVLGKVRGGGPRVISYSRTRVFGPDGKVVRETTVLNDGGESLSPAEVIETRK